MCVARRKWTALFLTVAMLFSMVPMEVFAAVKPPVWNEDAKEQSQKQEDWSLAKQNKIVRVANAEPIKTPSITYVGTYKNGDGRDVIRLSFDNFQNLATAVWHRLVLKTPDEITSKIDWQNPKTGMATRVYDGKLHDYYTTDMAPFEPLSQEKTGARGTYVQKLNDNKNLVGGSARISIPIDLVLKDGVRVQDLKGREMIQARLMDSKYKRVFSRASDRNPVVSYNAYTMTTVLPFMGSAPGAAPERGFAKDFAKGLNERIHDGLNRPFYRTNSYVVYGGGEGYVDVVYKQSKMVTSDNFGRKLKKQNDPLAFRQSIDEAFFSLLDDTAKSDGTVAEVTILDNHDKPYGGPTSKNTVSIKKSDFAQFPDEGLVVMQVAGPKWNGIYADADRALGLKTRTDGVDFNNAVLNTTTTEFNSGVATRVRYFVKEEELKKWIKEKGMSSFGFYSAIITGDAWGTSCFATQSPETIQLHKGEKVMLAYDMYQALNTSPGIYYNYDKMITIGTAPYEISFRDSIQPVSGVGAKTRLNFEWTVPFDMIIPQGTAISVRGINNGQSPTQQTLEMRRNNVPLVTFGHPTIEHKPRIVQWSPTLIGGALTQTFYLPMVDELFVDSKQVKGYSKYERAEVNLTFPGQALQHVSAHKVMKNVSVPTEKGVMYDAYSFDTKEPNIAGEEQIEQYPDFHMPTLKKDMPVKISNTDVVGAAIESEDVIEQVQTKVHFNLDADKDSFIEKIAPLNEQFSVDATTGRDNPAYVPNAFTGDHLKLIDGNQVTVERKGIDGSSKQVTYPNLADHNGLAYDLATEQGKADFLKRIFPDVAYDKELRRNVQTVKGWTTLPLTDKGGKRAIEQYNDLLKDKKMIRTAADWEKAKHEAYVFDADSPIAPNLSAVDVYAVWGGPALVLHANNTSNVQDEQQVVLPYTEEDRTKTLELIDTMTSATKDDLKGKLTIKRLPVAPYRFESQDNFDDVMKDFRKADATFIGWTLERHAGEQDPTFAAGNNNERIQQLIKGAVGLPTNTESDRYLQQQNKTAYIPNGFNFAYGKDVDTILSEGHDVHLYANYRPNFTISVDPRYRNIEGKNNNPTDGNYGQYVDNVEPSKKHPLSIGLLYRTAVTDYTTPTVLQNATYNPVSPEEMPANDADVLKTYDPAHPQALTWRLPGFDNLGRRRSYVSLVVPAGKENDYSHFSEFAWPSFGITTYVARNGQTGEAQWAKDAPKELHEEAKAAHVYGKQIAKRQAFTVDDVDAYTSATFRQPMAVDKGGFNEVTGYRIINTSSPAKVPTPLLNKIMEESTEISLDWGTTEDNAEITKVQVSLPMPGNADNQVVELLKKSDGTYQGAMNGAPITARKDNQKQKLVITKNPAFDFTGQAGKTVLVTYVDNNNVPSETAKTEIQKRPVSSKVTVLKQTANTADGKTTVAMQIPFENPTNQPLPGTTYVIEKHDKASGSWVKVGEGTMGPTQNPGDYIHITLDGVDHNDLIRVVSKEKYMDDGQEATKVDAKSIEDNNTQPNPQTDKGFLYIDREGPVAEAKAKDEAFRRWVEVKGKFDEIPEGGAFVLIVEREDGQIERKDMVKQATTIDSVRDLVSKGNVKNISIEAVDDKGNKHTSNVDYKKTHVLVLRIVTPLAKRSAISVSTVKAEKIKPVEGATVTITVTNAKGEEVATGSDTVGSARTKIALKANDGSVYKLQKGDIVKYKGTYENAGITYTTNPFKQIIR